MINKSRYKDLGTFENKQKAMLFRNNNYTWYSCYIEKKNGKVKLWVKLPKCVKMN